jgi:hypothetical protein
MKRKTGKATFTDILLENRFLAKRNREMGDMLNQVIDDLVYDADFDAFKDDGNILTLAEGLLAQYEEEDNEA